MPNNFYDEITIKVFAPLLKFYPSDVIAIFKNSMKRRIIL